MEQSEHVTYRQVSGRSIERIAALSDGLIAIALTLIVLEIHIPEASAIHTDQDLLCFSAFRRA